MFIQSASDPPIQSVPALLTPRPVLASNSGRSISATSLGYPLALASASPPDSPSRKPERRTAGGASTGAPSSGAASASRGDSAQTSVTAAATPAQKGITEGLVRGAQRMDFVYGPALGGARPK